MRIHLKGISAAKVAKGFFIHKYSTTEYLSTSFQTTKGKLWHIPPVIYSGSWEFTTGSQPHAVPRPMTRSNDSTGSCLISYNVSPITSGNGTCIPIDALTFEYNFQPIIVIKSHHFSCWSPALPANWLVVLHRQKRRTQYISRISEIPASRRW